MAYFAAALYNMIEAPIKAMQPVWNDLILAVTVVQSAERKKVLDDLAATERDNIIESREKVL